MFSSFQRVLIHLKVVKTNQKTYQNLTTVDYFGKAEVPGENFDPLKIIIYCFQVYFEAKAAVWTGRQFLLFCRDFWIHVVAIHSSEQQAVEHMALAGRVDPPARGGLQSLFCSPT